MLTLDYDGSDHSDDISIKEEFNANDDDFFGEENFAETLDSSRSRIESDNNESIDQNTDDELVVPKKEKIRDKHLEQEPIEQQIHGINQQTKMNLKCKRCPREFDTPQQLNGHSRIHKIKQRRKGLFPCTVCDKQCKTQSALNGHLAVHTRPVPKCDYCTRE